MIETLREGSQGPTGGRRLERNRKFVDSPLEEAVTSEPVSEIAYSRGIPDGNKQILAPKIAQNRQLWPPSSERAMASKPLRNEVFYACLGRPATEFTVYKKGRAVQAIPGSRPKYYIKSLLTDVD
jgi:hypothetical protein